MIQRSLCKGLNGGSLRMLTLVHLLLVANLLQVPTEPELSAHWSIHTVLPGDTVGCLAQRYLVTGEELRDWNGPFGDEPEVGRRLKVLSSVPSVERFRLRFKVKQETTWRALADRYQLPPKTLLELNKRKIGGKLPAGKRVTVYVTRDRWNKAWLDGGVQLTERPGLKVKEPKWSWGRPVAVRTIEAVADAIAEEFPGSSMVVGDLSYRRGGVSPPPLLIAVGWMLTSASSSRTNPSPSSSSTRSPATLMPGGPGS